MSTLNINAQTSSLQEPTTPAAAPANKLGVRDLSMAIALVAIWIFFALATHFTFVSPFNVSNLAVEMSIVAVLAMGSLLVIVAGEIDLSVGSGVGLVGGIAAVLISLHGWNAAAAMGVATLIAAILWLLMGSLIVTQRIPAFIITLAGLLIFRGLQWKVINSSTIPVAVGGQENLLSILTTWYLPALWSSVATGVLIVWLATAEMRRRKRRAQFGFPSEPIGVVILKLVIVAQLLTLFTLVCNQYRGIPLPVIILAITAGITAVLTRHTRFGRYVYAIGGNKEAAFVSGVPVTKTLIGVFGIAGLLVAVSGFLQTAYAGASTTGIGAQLELDAIAACVIGGVSLRGGKGNVSGVIFGALIMASLLNGMNLMGLTPEAKYIARGTVLALAVWLDVRLTRVS